MDKLRRSRGALTPVLCSLDPESTRKCGDVSGMFRSLAPHLRGLWHFGSVVVSPPVGRRTRRWKVRFSRALNGPGFAPHGRSTSPAAAVPNLEGNRVATVGSVVMVALAATRTFRVNANASCALARTVSRYSAVGTRVNCRHGFWGVEKKVFNFVTDEVEGLWVGFTPLCPAGHLPHRWGDRIVETSRPSLRLRIKRGASV